MHVLIIGTGGREQALASLMRAYGHEVELASALTTGLVRHGTLIVVGPEGPLVGGVVDYCHRHYPFAHIFGPSTLASQLEGSKIFTKTRCTRWGIPTADFDFAGSYAVAERIIKDRGFRVVKADGLCGGKGAHVTDSEEEALEIAHALLVGKIHGRAGARVLLEEKLEGAECSVMALCDGVEARLMPLARDYKRLSAGSAQMTGGVGAYTPLPDVDEQLLKTIKEQFFDTLLSRMRMEGETYLNSGGQQELCVGTPFQGVLFAGIMLTKQGPKLLEYNVRFGDPETQVVLALLQSDIVPSLLGCSTLGGLRGIEPLRWSSEAAVCVCVADNGYPAKGSRLASVVHTGATLALAREAAYREVRSRRSNSEIYREDIAAGL